MSKKWWASLVLAIVLVVAPDAEAQSPNFGPSVQSPFPPGYNPYLQLINPRAPLTSNYFNLVYPQLRVANNFQTLQEQNLNTRRGIDQFKNPVATTSRKVGFNTHSKYFESNKRNFGINNTTNTNIRPPLTDEALLMQFRPPISR